MYIGIAINLHTGWRGGLAVVGDATVDQYPETVETEDQATETVDGEGS